MNVTILGASGFIGRHLSAALRARGDVVTAASLRDLDTAVAACAGADAVVNLAGASVAGKRWTPAYKSEMRRSRVDATTALIERLSNVAVKPSIYVSASAVGYYGTSEGTFNENSSPGNDFLAHLCLDWEAAAKRAAGLGARVALVRTGVVLGRDGGALATMLPIFNLGAGGVIGSGRQWMSWIHIDDIVGIYLMALDRGTGAYNGTAPMPATNAEFTKALSHAIKRPAFAPVPPFALRLLYGEGATVVLDGQRVIPQRTQAEGYTFAFGTLESALANLFG